VAATVLIRYASDDCQPPLRRGVGTFSAHRLIAETPPRINAVIERVIMHMPRPITLTERELRVLRAMERALADEDPVLALVLRGPDADDTGRARKAARRRQRRSVWGYPVVALSGLVLDVLAVMGGWTTGLLVLMLAAVPIAVHLGAAFPGPSDRRGRGRTDGDDPSGPSRHR
jgi:hypothetical protein